MRRRLLLGLAASAGLLLLVARGMGGGELRRRLSGLDLLLEDQLQTVHSHSHEPQLPSTPDWFRHLPNSTSVWSSLATTPSPRRYAYHHAHPQLAFIKTVKVGGTSVAVALDRAARFYNVSLQPAQVSKAFALVLHPGDKRIQCNTGEASSLWFHHGFRQAWMTDCIPHVRFVTLLREPVAQSLSWQAFLLSKSYYSRYPDVECDAVPEIDFSFLHSRGELTNALNSVSSCRHVEYRRNITMQLMAHEFMARSSPDVPVYRGLEWIASGKVNVRDAQAMISLLDSSFFLVGVTERLNEFLVLLALHMGWEVEKLYYERCKPTDLNLAVSEFASRFPEVAARLERDMEPATQMYEHVKQEFDTKIRRLYDELPELTHLVAKFENGLLEFQQGRPRVRRWEMYHTKDGETLLC